MSKKHSRRAFPGTQLMIDRPNPFANIERLIRLSGDDTVGLRSLAYDMEGQGSRKSLLDAANTYLDAAHSDPNPERALLDIAKAAEVFERVFSVDILNSNLPSPDSIAAERALAFIPHHQAIILGIEPSASFKLETELRLARLSQMIDYLWPEYFPDNNVTRYIRESDLNGVISEHIVTSLLLRYGNRHIVNSDGTIDTSWIILPSSAKQDNAGIKNCDQNMSWDLSEMIWDSSTRQPTLERKIQIKTAAAQQEYDAEIAIVSLKNDIYKPYANSHGRRHVGSREVLRNLHEDYFDTNREASRALDDMTNLLLDALEK